MSERFHPEGHYLIEIVGAVFTVSGKGLSLASKVVLLFCFQAFVGLIVSVGVCMFLLYSKLWGTI